MTDVLGRTFCVAAQMETSQPCRTTTSPTELLTGIMQPSKPLANRCSPHSLDLCVCASACQYECWLYSYVN